MKSSRHQSDAARKALYERVMKAISPPAERPAREPLLSESDEPGHRVPPRMRRR